MAANSRYEADRRPVNPQQQGIYLICNDAVLDWTISLLRGLRASNPDLPVIMIPFDQNYARTAEIAGTYDVSFWQDEGLLQRFDKLGARFWPNSPVGAHMFRKLAAFFGPLNTFIYLDVDCVVNQPLGDILNVAERHPRHFLYSDPEPESVILMSDAAIDIRRGGAWFNAGIFASTRGSFSLDAIDDLVEDLLQGGTELVTGEQSFLNILVRRSGLPVAQLDSVVPGFPPYTFAKQVAERPWPEARSWPVIHWAGESMATNMSLRKIYRHHRIRRRSPVDTVKFLVWNSRLRPALQSAWVSSKRLTANIHSEGGRKG
jgi:hypothetical protein